MEKDLDKKLYNDFFTGEKQAFEYLYNKYKKRIEYFIFNIVKDYQKAEDLTQETFIYVMQNKMLENTSFKYYVYLVAKSKAYNYINVEKRRDEITNQYSLDEQEKIEKDILELIIKEENKKDLLSAIEKLDEKYRNAIYLVNIEGLSYEETSKILGQSLQNTKSLIHRGKKQLKVILLKKGFDNMNKVSKVVIVLLCIIVAFSGIAYAARLWEIKFEKFEKKWKGPDEAIEESKESGFLEEFDSKYDAKNGVEVKIDSYLKTDDCLNMTFCFKFAENIEVNSGTFEFGYIIYDENKNVYSVSPRINIVSNDSPHDSVAAIFKEMNIDYDDENIYKNVFEDSRSIEGEETEEERTIAKKLSIRAKNKFPNSEKLYVKVFDLGYTMIDVSSINQDMSLEDIVSEDFKINDNEWIFELDVPEKFSNSTAIELKVKEEIPNIEFKSCTLTETGMVILLKTDEHIDYICIGEEIKNNPQNKGKSIFNIVDSEGKFYDNISAGFTTEGLQKIIVDVPKSAFEKGLFVNYEKNDVEYKTELVEI